MIKTRVPQDCAVKLIDLPYSVDELVSLDEEGFASIYLNARHSHEKQEKSLRHALRHLEGDDFYNNKDIRTIEREADGKPQIPEELPKLEYDTDKIMLTLRRYALRANADLPEPVYHLFHADIVPFSADFRQDSTGHFRDSFGPISSFVNSLLNGT